MAEQKPPHNEYLDAYSDAGFWRKLRRYAGRAGREVVEKALLMYYAAQREETPRWARATVYASLGYFIAPLDAIVDLTPGIGYADDLGVLVLAFATVTQYIDDGVRRKTRAQLDRWFGDTAPPPGKGDDDTEASR